MKFSTRFFIRLFSIKEMGVFIILVAMTAAISVLKPSFATRSNAVSILQAISPVAIMAIGQTFVILTAGIDLSVGSVCALSAYLMTVVLTSESGPPLLLGLITALGTGAFCGFFSGILVTKLRVTPFIVTLGMLSACSGLTLGLSGGKQIGLNKFGREETVRFSLADPHGETRGRPLLERVYYGKGEETFFLQPRPEGGFWIGESTPTCVRLLDGSWNIVSDFLFQPAARISSLSLPDGSLLVGESPAGILWKLSRDGTKSVFFETGRSCLPQAVSGPGKTTWILCSDPAEAVMVSERGEVRQRLTLPEGKTVTSATSAEDGTIYFSATDPPVLGKITPSGEFRILYRSTDSWLGGLRVSSPERIYFIEGNGRDSRLCCLDHGEKTNIWETPKPPIRDFLVFPGGNILVSTGNVGALYLLRPGGRTERIHPMTRFKGRLLVGPTSAGLILIGNAGPAGVTTMPPYTSETVYPVAEVFNRLFAWAPLATVLLVISAAFFLRYTTWGRHLYAIGGNETAARLSGVQVDRVKIFAYTTTGLLSGLAAVFMTSKLHTLDPNLAKGYELKVIAAVVIGGTSLMGGEGSVWGTLIGACLLYVLNYALVHLGMEDIWSDLFVGIVIILAAVIDSTRSQVRHVFRYVQRILTKPSRSPS